MAALTSTPSSQNLAASTVQVTNRTPYTPSPQPARPTQPAQSAQNTPSPGQWRHPKFDEIAQRHTAATFDQSSLNIILYNFGGLAAVLYFNDYFFRVFHILPLPFQRQIDLLAWLLLHITPLYNITRTVLPLVRTPDNLSDIDLTPTQRALMGLDPTATPPATPDTQYVTPPKYARSATPRSRSGSPANWSHMAAAASGGSRRASPLGPGQMGASAVDWSPSPAMAAASPLWQRGLGGLSKESERRRHSYGLAPVPPATPTEGGSVFAPNTPSPTERGQGIITSRWIYNHGRSKSGHRNSFTGF